jgi:hypothetical protein
MDLTDVYRVFNLATAQFTYLHILVQKAILNKYKKIEIAPCMLSDHRQ